MSVAGPLCVLTVVMLVSVTISRWSMSFGMAHIHRSVCGSLNVKGIRPTQPFQSTSHGTTGPSGCESVLSDHDVTGVTESEEVMEGAVLERGNLVLKQLCERLNEKLDESLRASTPASSPASSACTSPTLRRIHPVSLGAPRRLAPQRNPPMDAELCDFRLI